MVEPPSLQVREKTLFLSLHSYSYYELLFWMQGKCCIELYSLCYKRKKGGTEWKEEGISFGKGLTSW